MKSLLTFALLTSAIWLISYKVKGQSDTLTTSSSKNDNLFRRVGRDGKLTGQTILDTYRRPFHWQKKQWTQFGLVIGVSAAASTLDQPIWNSMQKNRTEFLDNLSSVGNFLGQPENNYPFMIAVWGTGVIVKNEWIRDTGIMLFASVTTSGLIQTFSKEFVGRARPVSGKGPYEFNPFGGVSYHSFPSGHTMLAVAMNWILARRINWLPAKILFYSLPVLVGTSRLYEGAHWFSDILLGSALGIACAESVLRIYPKLKREGEEGLSLTTTGTGMGLVYTFK